MARRKLGWAFAFCVAVLRPLLMTLTKQDWKNTDKLPQSGGHVLVANHISHIDPLTYAHFVYDSGRLPRYLAKAEVMDLPVLRIILKSAGQIPVYRQSRTASEAFRAAAAAVEKGECVVVYPEGTITRDPDLWPMVGKSGAARIALETRCPVIPIGQWGAQEVLAPYARKPDLFPRKKIDMKVGDPVDLSDLYELERTPAVVNQATERIMAVLTDLVEEVRGGTAPAERFDPRKAGVAQIGNPKNQKKTQKKSAQQQVPGEDPS